MSDPFVSDHRVPEKLPRSGERLWRVRKDSCTMDAEIRVYPDGLGGGVEVQFFYRSEFIYGHRWATRLLAVADANNKLKELQRSGWTTHW